MQCDYVKPEHTSRADCSVINNNNHAHTGIAIRYKKAYGTEHEQDNGKSLTKTTSLLT